MYFITFCYRVLKNVGSPNMKLYTGWFGVTALPWFIILWVWLGPNRNLKCAPNFLPTLPCIDFTPLYLQTKFHRSHCWNVQKDLTHPRTLLYEMEGTETLQRGMWWNSHLSRAFNQVKNTYMCHSVASAIRNNFMDVLETGPNDILENFCTPSWCRRIFSYPT